MQKHQNCWGCKTVASIFLCPVQVSGISCFLDVLMETVRNHKSIPNVLVPLSLQLWMACLPPSSVTVKRAVAKHLLNLALPVGNLNWKKIWNAMRRLPCLLNRCCPRVDVSFVALWMCWNALKTTKHNSLTVKSLVPRRTHKFIKTNVRVWWATMHAKSGETPVQSPVAVNTPLKTLTTHCTYCTWANKTNNSRPLQWTTEVPGPTQSLHCIWRNPKTMHWYNPNCFLSTLPGVKK